MSEEARQKLTAKLTNLREGEQQLSKLGGVVKQGAGIIRRAIEAGREAAVYRDRDRTSVELRTGIDSLFASMGLDPPQRKESIGDTLAHLQQVVNGQITAIETRQLQRAAIGERITNLKAARASQEEANAKTQVANDEYASTKAALKEFSQKRSRARALRDTAEAGRTRIVRRVFNESLNRTWRDLFVRLAPEEPFVPAFEVPETSGRVSANLLTTHRDGTPAGSPAAMLSAGNLNTAALTLFLALHLSAGPRLPWLLLDDPVQSMDEIHVAQFAALLRTLAKEHRRQMVIAVHERQLFEYLTLELSPSAVGDRLATIDLTRSPDGSTAVHPTTFEYVPDAVQLAA